MTNRYALPLMPSGQNTPRWALRALTVMLIAAVALPVPAAAQNNEYDLNLPGAGSGGSSESEGGSTTVAPTYVPAAPTVTDPTITEEGATGRDRKRRDRPEGPTDPVLTTSAVNATAGPQEIPTLSVPDDEGGIPTPALGLALLAAACCILAVWRLRFLRELPTATRPRAARTEPSS